MRFDKSAFSYERHAVVQFEIANSLLKDLPIKQPRAEMILDLGCGPGNSAFELARLYPEARVIAIDLSGAMIEKASTMYQKENLVFLQGDLEDEKFWESLKKKCTGKVDLVFSSSAFQWIKNPVFVLKSLRELINPNGQFFLSVFLEGTMRELEKSLNEFGYQYIDDCALRAEVEMRTIFNDAGFVLETFETAVQKSYFASLRDVLKHIQLTGTQRGLNRVLHAKGFRQVEKYYQTQFGDEAGLALSWHFAKCVLQMKNQTSHPMDRGMKKYLK
jgi:malonyl-ACP O-methyltransferase BioC